MNMASRKNAPDLQLAFDVGHSSIGWAVLQNQPQLEVKGCGVVIFRADDCLASTRRQYRRQRRHIRSTRQRIKRMKVLLEHLGVITADQLNKPGCAWPWKLAARVLAGGKTLSWPELWDVLRWYAHNRGYDANRRWSAAEVEAEKEDAEKVQNAHTLMDESGNKTMAETFCAVCGVDPLGVKCSSNPEPAKRFKAKNAAFPRRIVEAEVARILRVHFGKLKGVDEKFAAALFSDWRAIPCADIKLPQRYQGGLLFGQLVPRFDNRIISTCPITGQKVPSRNTPEFLNFRWGMLLANVRVARLADRELKPLTAEERKELDGIMRKEGAMTAKQFTDAVEKVTGAIRHNLATMLMHPDAKEALVLDPVQECVTTEKPIPVKTLFAAVPTRIQKRARGQLRRGKSFTFAALYEASKQAGESVAAFDAAIQQLLDKASGKGRKKDKPLTRDELLAKSLSVRKLSGRAAYARPILAKAFAEVMTGKHPKEEGGCLFVTEQMRQAQLSRSLAKQTNNHLVRHRLLILERLQRDIIKEFADGDKSRVAQIVIEVNRDLREMSGKTAKERAQDLGSRIANHHHVAEKLEKAFAGQKFSGKPIAIGAGLIRKARIAEDLGWTCPYTGQKYEPINLVTRHVDKDHIVPRSQRMSDALEALVITFSAVNKWKGKRTALKFVEDEQGKPVPGAPNLSIVSLARYRDFVESLESFKGHNDDKKRKKHRKELMKVRDYEEGEFTPRDLTQTSQLVRLGAQMLKRAYSEEESQPVIVSMPGSVTGALRNGLKLLGCLSKACPHVLDGTGEVKTKTEIRDITHLHHALDACVLGLSAHFIPNNGSVWELIVKRNLSDAEKEQLRAATHGIFNYTSEGFRVADLSDPLKDQLRKRLAEKRVVQHIPKRMSGLRVEQNIWRVLEIKGNEVIVRQRIRQADGSRKKKEVPEKRVKLLGLVPLNGIGKLSANNGVLVIPDNYGVAILDHAKDKNDRFVIIPWHLVHKRIFKGIAGEKSLLDRNGRRMPRILRNGQIVRVAEGTYKGAWRITSIKNQKTGVKLNLGQPDTVNTEEEVLDLATAKKTRKVRADCRHEASLASIVSGGLQMLTLSLTGYPVQSTETDGKA
jgi:CRISPR-associated endonuclease Csn1